MVLSVLAGLLGAVLVDALQPARYAAGATLLVSTGDPYNSTRLASTYAAALPDDGGLLRAVSRALDVPEEEIPDSLSVESDTETSVMRIEYGASTERDALLGARTAVRALTGSSPAAVSVPADGLEVVREARITATPSSGVSTGALAVGAVLGLFLGIVLAIGLERSDRRVESVEDLRAALGGLPVTALLRRGETLTPALMERWRDLAHHEAPLVAIVSTDGLQSRRLEDITARAPSGSGARGGAAGAEPDELDVELGRPALGNRTRTLEHSRGDLRTRALESVPARDGIVSDGGEAREDVRLVVGGPLGTDGNAEMVAQKTDMTVIAVRRGARERDVSSDVALLEQYGVKPSWGLLTG